STRQVVESAASILAHFHEQETSGRLTRTQAQDEAKSAIKAMRYSGQQYFFITDMEPVMLVNPFSPKLIGTNVTGVVDPNGFHVFAGTAEEVRRHGEGFVSYSWPKPGKVEPQPKLTFVTGFAPWGWVIGSGVYLDDINAAVTAMALELGGVVFVAGILTVGFGIVVAKGITSPISGITARATRLARGDVESSVPYVTLTNEVGDIARSIEVFRDAAVVKGRLEAEAAVRQQREEEKLRRTEQAYEAAGASQSAVVVAMAEGLTRLAHGDLAFRLRQDFTGEYQQLKSDFNSALENLERAMTSIASVTLSVDRGSDQIAQSSDDLSRRTEQQAASLEETAAALDVITHTVKTMAANAQETAKVVVTTKGAAETSGAIVRQAVAAMSKIQESSSQITNIIGVIDEIAFQTNLLALNAGVEAARAGDAGRGFAVVASEVRALAQRSAEAAKEIKTLISASTAQVENGVVLVDKTGLALKDIIVKVTEMDALVRQISSASHEQATGLAEINTAIGQMDQIVQQNAAMVEQSTAAAHGLKTESQELTAMVGHFQIGGAGTSPARSLRRQG
ncbi:MAG: methyl-accepting chemotaxis protein, partial [Beijerinckiaceae bacterium]|nr:methyl-accepting chemotaxis protein [Beijerinckiaceae bacterium]